MRQIKGYEEKKLSLAPSQEYVEVIELTKKALNWQYPFYKSNYEVGYFSLPIGQYQITIYEPFRVSEYYLHSEPIIIEVK